ncbi:MAG: type II toxin-antitoxin system Phd/YefM family antitoxin [Caulobacteraceae bacterium]
MTSSPLAKGVIFTVHQAKTQLSKLIASALEGEEVVIARGATPVIWRSPTRTPSTAC